MMLYDVIRCVMMLYDVLLCYGMFYDVYMMCYYVMGCVIGCDMIRL